MKNNVQANYWMLAGYVQGVGFRPFVYRLAHRLGLTGWVRNQKGRVIIFAQGRPEQLADFQTALIKDSPPLAQPRIRRVGRRKFVPLADFSIRRSCGTRGAESHVPPDFFACDDCLAELGNPSDRRYRYPFINCTQCGPRYTLIERLPYDRCNTAMAAFPLCDKCLSEYEDPLDRRFHAQPLACPDCGPNLRFHKIEPHSIQTRSETAGKTPEALAACIRRLRQGKVLAIKGIGGYHLFCDARND